jgi:hypothetical protein
MKTPPKKATGDESEMFREKPMEKHGVAQILSGKQWKPYIYIIYIYRNIGIYRNI